MRGAHHGSDRKLACAGAKATQRSLTAWRSSKFWKSRKSWRSWQPSGTHSVIHQIGAGIRHTPRVAFFGKLLHQRTLFGGEAGGCQHLEFIQKIAGRLRTASWNAATLEPQCFSGLTLSGDLERYLP